MLKFSNEFFQQPTKQTRPLKEFAVGRTVFHEGIWWEVVLHRESPVFVAGTTRLKSIGLIGRPRITWVPSHTMMEE